MNTAVQRSFLLSVVFCALFSIQNSFVYAYSLGAPHWVTRPSVNGGLIFGGSCYPDINGNMVCDPPICFAYSLDAFMPFGIMSYDGVFYTDSSCSNPSGIPLTTWSRIKEAICPAGEVMVGTRFYEWKNEVDEEHQDAQCASISGVTLGTSRWVIPSNAYDTLRPGYKDAVCNTNEVMTGVRMYGVGVEVDDEHIIARCTVITGVISGGGHSWKVAPNAYSSLNGSYKEASCNSGDIMRGVRWYEYAKEMDDEHTDAYCYTPPPPTVNVWFSMFVKKVLNFI